MSGCGSSGSRWRALAERAIYTNRGLAEHLAVQYDFMLQGWLNPRTEYEIPQASKNLFTSGQPGFADIVALTTGEVWEIKPENDENGAVEQARHYLKFARKHCLGSVWRLGLSYVSTNTWGTPGVVWRITGPVTAELWARQGQGGAVLYEWRIDGKPDEAFVRTYHFSLRQDIVNRLLPALVAPSAAPAPGTDYGDFGAPVLLPQDVAPEFRRFTPDLERSMSGRVTQLITGGVVEFVVERTVHDLLVGAAAVQRTQESLKVAGMSTKLGEQYARDLAVFVGQLKAHLTVLGVVTAAIGLVVLVVLAAPEELGIGSSAVLIAGTAATRAALLRVGFALAGLVTVLVPTVANASDPSKDPYTAAAVVPTVRTPDQARASSLGAVRNMDGHEWVVIGIARAVVVG